MLYHVTERRDLPSILRDGLLPRIGPRSKDLGESEPAIFCFPGLADVENALLNWLGEWYEDHDMLDVEIVVLEIHPEGLAVESSLSWEHPIRSPIPASAIVRILGEDLAPLAADIDDLARDAPAEG